jgi:hypothetical protein
MMTYHAPVSAREERLLRDRLEHLGKAWTETKKYAPFGNSAADPIARGVQMIGNGVGKFAHGIIKIPDATVHQIFDPTRPTELGTGPLRRTRRLIGNQIDRVLDGTLIHHPFKTTATTAYEVVFEAPQQLFLDAPETLTGQTNN